MANSEHLKNEIYESFPIKMTEENDLQCALNILLIWNNNLSFFNHNK